MLVTTVEASVDEARVSDLMAAWEQTTKGGAFPDGLIESTLVRGEGGVWRILTVWESREALTAMRSEQKPAALSMFEAAGAMPSVTLWEVEGHVRSA